MDEISVLTRRVKILLVLCIIGIALSGITAIPLLWELGLFNRALSGLTRHFHILQPALDWYKLVYQGLQVVGANYPYVAYGTDWLAFGHIIIAIAFIGPLRDPVRNVWVVELGMIACVLVIPTAFIMGPIRHIPFFHQLIDCSFGVVGFFPLWLIHRYIARISALEKVN